MIMDHTTHAPVFIEGYVAIIEYPPDTNSVDDLTEKRYIFCILRSPCFEDEKESNVEKAHHGWLLRWFRSFESWELYPYKDHETTRWSTLYVA
jgi:hypothetical protein